MPVKKIKKKLKRKARVAAKRVARKVKSQLDEFLLNLQNTKVKKLVKRIKQSSKKNTDLFKWDGDTTARKLAENILERAKKIRRSLRKRKP